MISIKKTLAQICTWIGGQDYSMNEVKTGKKWIDGKPIYRKVVNLGALPNNTQKSVAHNIVNLGEFTSVSFYARVNTSAKLTCPMPSATPDGFEYTHYAYAANDGIYIKTRSNESGWDNCIAILEYTKSTD